MASAGSDVRIWRAADGQLFKTWDLNGTTCRKLAFSPNQSLLFGQTDKSEIIVWGQRPEQAKAAADAEQIPDNATLLDEHVYSVLGKRHLPGFQSQIVWLFDGEKLTNWKRPLTPLNAKIAAGIVSNLDNETKEIGASFELEIEFKAEGKNPAFINFFNGNRYIEFRNGQIQLFAKAIPGQNESGNLVSAAPYKEREWNILRLSNYSNRIAMQCNQSEVTTVTVPALRVPTKMTLAPRHDKKIEFRRIRALPVKE